MTLSKRERVFKAFEHEEPDMVPIYNMGFEKSATAYQDFIASPVYKENHTVIKNTYSRFRNKHAGDITEQRFWNVDTWSMDPFQASAFYGKLQKFATNDVPGYPDCVLEFIGGRIVKFAPRDKTGLTYMWYIGPYYKTKEVLLKYWDEHGKPVEYINDRVNYSPQVWDEYVESLSPYLYPMAPLPCPMHESLIEGMGLDRIGFYMRKDPTFIKHVMNEYAKLNVEIVKRLSEAGVEIAFYLDDLGQKERTIFSLKSFRELILPAYKKIYDACKKRGMLIAQHSCGFIDDFIPDMVDAGLDGIQALEPAAGVDLATLKKKFGDKLTLMGGMDSSRVLNFGNPEQVAEDVKNCIKKAGMGGGYFAGPSHNTLDAPWENVLALRDAIEKYRKYPLNG